MFGDSGGFFGFVLFFLFFLVFFFAVMSRKDGSAGHWGWSRLELALHRETSVTF